jgi:aminomethyltransferase
VQQTPVLREFSNIGFDGARRRFPGFSSRASLYSHSLFPRDACRFDLKTGDLLSLETPLSKQSATLLVFDATGQVNPAALGLTQNGLVNFDAFDHRALLGWYAGLGGESLADAAVTQLDLDNLLVFSAKTDCIVWVIRELPIETLAYGALAGQITVTKTVAAPAIDDLLPPPLGEIRDEFTVSRGTAAAYEVAEGETVQIIDVEGQQCSDFTALRVDALYKGIEREIDSTATRTMVRGAYPGPGLLDKFFDRDLNPMMRVVQDTCGRHDAFGMACTARGYEERGFPGHLNCSDNISHAVAPYDIGKRVAWPAINFFWNTWVDPHSHQLLTEESHSRPGDYVALQALRPLICASTACPDDLDPINGWNPTDVHVRIYKKDAPIRRAVAYREKENAPMSISQQSAFEPETSKLTKHFAPARDLWSPVSFPSTGTIGEYWACREGVTIQDMSGLRKYDVVGPDAERLLQKATTRDVSRLAVWRGSYTLMCDEAGQVIDDGTLFRLGPEQFRWCCGTEESGRQLDAIAKREELQVRIHGMGNALPNLALQGPKSRDVIRRLAFTQPTVPSVDDLRWFGVTVARVKDRDGIPFMLSRSGYTGELGYEVFCAKEHAPGLWRAILEAGEEFGITPMGSAALEILRVEAGLAAANAEFAPGADAFEAGLGFAVSLKKGDFVGHAALSRNADNPRKVLRGLWFEGDDVPTHGAQVFSGERPVGLVTSAVRSPMYKRAIAMARLSVEFSATDTPLEVGQLDGHMKRLPAVVCDIPFYDPKREKARA